MTVASRAPERSLPAESLVPDGPAPIVGRRFDLPIVRRSGWRQDLVDTERGLVAGFRGGAGVCGQLFVASIVGLAGVLFGLSAIQWLLVTVMLTGLLVCELFRQAILRLDSPIDSGLVGGPRSRSDVAGLLLAAMTVARMGTAIGLVILFADRLGGLLGGP